MYVLARALSRTLWQQMGSISGSPSGSCQGVPSRAQFVLRAVRRSVASGAYGERGACLVGSGAGAGPPRPLRSRSLSTHPASNATVMATRMARASMDFSQLIATASLLVATSTHARDPKSRLAEECGNSWLGGLRFVSQPSVQRHAPKNYLRLKSHSRSTRHGAIHIRGAGGHACHLASVTKSVAVVWIVATRLESKPTSWRKSLSPPVSP
jgi:hypothetical protein